MKKEIHPEYGWVLYRCPASGTERLTRSTKLNGPKETYNGKEVSVITIEICADNHPFYTGKQGLVDATGRVETFNKRFSGFRRKK